MPQLQPAHITLAPHDEDDPRLGTLLGQAAKTPETAQVVLVGFPTDEGVRRNGGRVGASLAPDAIRRALFKLTPDVERFEAFVELVRHTADAGNLVVGGDLEADQAALGRFLVPHLERGAICIILGGGHETSYGHFLGYALRSGTVEILNWDAHADVRPLKEGLAHSGSPFRQSLEHSSRCCRHYTVAGLNPQTVAKAHLDYLVRHHAQVHFSHELFRPAIERIYAALSRDAFTTFDMDAVDQAFAPGVSAPAACGLSPDVWLHAAYQAGKCPHVRSFDLVEVNPIHDVDDRTARLAALTVWRFLQGLCDRLPAVSSASRPA